MKAIYIHIPFCKSICSYCDFSKMFYNKEWVNKYLDSLENELKKNYHNEIVKTIYIGGGTPNSLSDNELERLLYILSFIKKDKSYEYTIECNIELLTMSQINLFKKYDINRVSLGIQTFNEKYLKLINRSHTKKEVFDKIKLLKDSGITNINVDLMYAYPKQSLRELKKDIRLFKKLNVTHISTYSLMIEPHTVLYNKGYVPIDDSLDYKMYNLIIKELNKYNHYETSNFAIKGYESRHNLTYWNNENYLGIGLSSSGYIDNIRYDNTRSLNEYLNGKYILNREILDLNMTIENEFILGLRKTYGIDINRFKERYNKDILEFEVVKRLIREDKLVLDNTYLRLNNKYLYLANQVLVEFLGEDYEK